MTTFAAYDHNSIYALGHTPEVAARNACNATRDDTALFEIAPIDEGMAAWIDENGWDGMSRSFEVRDGTIVDTTDH